MTVDAPEQPTPVSQYPVRDEEVIDLRIYVDILLRWWREIALLTLLGAFLAGAVAVLLDNARTPTYAASSTAIMARLTSNVTLDDRFQTLSDENASIGTARRASLTGLVRSGSIAAAVIEELDAELPAELRSTSAILEQIDASAVPSTDNRTPSDLIRITARADTPEVAAAIANAWMRHYVDEANALYGQVPGEVYDAVVAEQVEADANFAAAQQTLENFIAESRIPSLTRQIEERQALVDFLDQSRVDAGTAALAQDVNRRIALFESLSAAQVEPVLALLNEQTDQRIRTIANLLAARSRAVRQLAQAQALQTQIEQGGDAASASNAVALQLLKTQIFANSETVERDAVERSATIGEQIISLPILESQQPNAQQWSIDATSIPTTAEEQLQDVTALVTSLEEYISTLDDAIAESGALAGRGEDYLFLDQLSGDRFTTAVGTTVEGDEQATADVLADAIVTSYADLLQTGALTQLNLAQDAPTDMADQPDALLSLEAEIQQLSAALAAEQARERQLTQQRDLAWNAYDTLSNKVVELDLERTAANREVRAGAEATIPLAPLPGRSPVVAVGIGGVIGFLAGIVLAFLMDYQGKQPILRRRSAAA